MVMGPTHAASGAAAGILAALWLPTEYGGAESLGAAVLYGGVAAGAALLPDFDHPTSTVSRSGGILTGLMHHVVDAVSLGFRSMTSSKDDDTAKSGHRGLTHTLLFAAIIGALVWYTATTPVVAAVVIGICLWWAILGLNGYWADRNPIYAVATPAIIAVAAAFWLPGLTNPKGLGVAIVVGLTMHCLGDALTITGTPLLAPLIPFGGKRWWSWRIPAPLTIKADGIGNAVLMMLFGGMTAALPIILSPTVAPMLYTSWQWEWIGRASTWAWM